MDIQDIETFPAEPANQPEKILHSFAKGGRMGRFQDMIEMKLMGVRDPLLRHPFFNAVLDGKGGSAVRKRHLMASPLKGLAEIHNRLRGSGPFPVAE
jgi:hypothetical protein